MSAARKLGQICPNQKILLVDAQLAGEGASSRNSGYLVDTTRTMDLHPTKNWKVIKKTDIYSLGIEAIKNFIKNIKLIAIGMKVENILHHQKLKTKILDNFSRTLSKLVLSIIF